MKQELNFPVYTKSLKDKGEFYRVDADRSSVSVRLGYVTGVGHCKDMTDFDFDWLVSMTPSSEDEFVFALADYFRRVGNEMYEKIRPVDDLFLEAYEISLMPRTKARRIPVKKMQEPEE